MTSTSPAPPAATGTQASSSLRGRTQRMAGLRKIIAQRMVESLQVSAQLTSVVEVDLTGDIKVVKTATDTYTARSVILTTNPTATASCCGSRSTTSTKQWGVSPT